MRSKVWKVTQSSFFIGQKILKAPFGERSKEPGVGFASEGFHMPMTALDRSSEVRGAGCP